MFKILVTNTVNCKFTFIFFFLQLLMVMVLSWISCYLRVSNFSFFILINNLDFFFITTAATREKY